MSPDRYPDWPHVERSPTDAIYDGKLRTRHGFDCQDRVDPDFYNGSQFRALDLWLNLPPAARGSKPPFLHVVDTLKAFPYTRQNRATGEVHLVLDQHLVRLIQLLTRHIVLDSTPDRAAVEVEDLFAERLALGGLAREAHLVSVFAHFKKQEMGPTREMHRGNRAQFDCLSRGAWMFIIAHELAHAFLFDDAAAAISAEFERRSEAAIVELEQLAANLEFKGPSFDDDWRVLPFVSLVRRLRSQSAGHPIDEVRDHIAFLREQLNNPSLRREATCDLFAAAAVWPAMLEKRDAPAPVALATCVMAMAFVTLIQRLDDAARPGAEPPSTKLAELAARMSLLRGGFTADTAHLSISQGPLQANELATGEERRLASRAIGGVANVVAETFGRPLLSRWELLPSMLLSEVKPKT